MTRTAAPVQVLHFARPSIASRARQLQEAVAGRRDADAVRHAELLGAALRQLAEDRRDRPAFLHGALLERAVGALEEAASDEDPAALADARTWLHDLTASIGKTWALREGCAGPLDGQERAARRAVHGAANLLAALECGSLGEALLQAERLTHELARAQRDREAALLLERVEALELRLNGGSERLIGLAAAGLEAVVRRALAAIDPGDLSRPSSPHGPACPAPAARHAGLGLIAFAMLDPVALADEASEAAAHLRAPEAVEAGWGQVADDLLNRVEGLRACLSRRDRTGAIQASERVEAVLAWLDALDVARPPPRLELVAAAG